MLSKHKDPPKMYRFKIEKIDGTGTGCEVNAISSYYAMKRAITLLHLPKDYKGLVTIQNLGETLPHP